VFERLVSVRAANFGGAVLWAERTGGETGAKA
jgi:hypothetical protein